VVNRKSVLKWWGLAVVLSMFIGLEIFSRDGMELAENSANFGDHMVQMADGWFPSNISERSNSATFVRSGVRSWFSAPGHAHFKFFDAINEEFRAGLITHSTEYKRYPWGQARIVNRSFYSDVMKISPPEVGVQLFVPEKNLLIEVVAIENIEGVLDAR